MRQRVVVGGTTIYIEVAQHSASVWIASGMYMGERVQTTDQSAAMAAMKWREVAAHKGN